MALSYESTRGGQKGVTASQAILKGLAEDGGLSCYRDPKAGQDFRTACRNDLSGNSL